MADVTEFRKRFPEFADAGIYLDSRIQLYLDDSALELEETKFGDEYDRAHSYLSAHYLALSLQTEASGGSGTGSAGPVNNKKVGELQIGYDSSSVAAIAARNPNHYALTGYGQIFISIRRRLCTGAWIA